MRPYTAFHTNVNYVDQLFKFAVVVRVLVAVSTPTCNMFLHRIWRTSTSFSLIPMHLLVYPFPMAMTLWWSAIGLTS
jgi:hypothetical protein